MLFKASDRGDLSRETNASVVGCRCERS
jgi:hypothetical protein